MTLIVFVKSLISVWIVLASITIQGYKFILPFENVLPINILAQILGYVGATPFTFFLPSIVCATLGVLGLPNSWKDGVTELFLAMEDDLGAHRGPLAFGRRIWNTTMTVLIPFWPFMNETCQEYEPSASQIYAPVVDDEVWIYINGICTTRDLNKGNCVKLNELFHRKVYSVHNPTHSMWYDLLECAMGKVGLFGDLVPPRRLLKKVLKHHLHQAKKDGKKKVVLIAHSQGTIITGRALEEMGEHGDPETTALMKEMLHVYLFANCANVMPVENVKYLENISNRKDVVAWLGEFFPFPNFWVSNDHESIDKTPTVEIPNHWGHLLNTHYLIPMRKNPEVFQKSTLVQQLMIGKHDVPSSMDVAEPKVTKQE